MSQKKPQGVLLINLGTPDGEASQGPSVTQVRHYLRQFLMDPYVVDIPFLARWFLVTAIILPKRPAQSAEAYKKIWTERGSPLLFHHLDLTKGVQNELGSSYCVEAAMRYGNPSIESAIRKLRERGVEEVLIFPLYPQYSLAATKSSLDACEKAIRHQAPGWKVQFYPAFYRHPGFLDAFADTAKRNLEGYDFDYLLFSFHGLPERQVRRTDLTGTHCFGNSDCCEVIGEVNRDCYRAQCFATARALAARLSLKPDRYSISFQSRLGRTPWIRPYTDFLYPELARRGVKRLAVMCPAFVADCLETLEEIAIRGRETFIGLGGEDLRLVPSLNAQEIWIRAVAQMVSEIRTIAD